MADSHAPETLCDELNAGRGRDRDSPLAVRFTLYGCRTWFPVTVHGLFMPALLTSIAKSNTVRLFAVGLVALLWTYWQTLSTLAARWDSEPLYSHCFLVPVFCGVIVWLRREQFRDVRLAPNWLGLPLLALGVGMRLAAARYYLEWFDGLSLIPCVGGLVLLTGGFPLLKVVYPAVLFLGFMIPLPFRFETALAGPLQSVATMASTLGLQMCGYPAISEGNLILIREHTIGVAEACSGLRMLVVFFAISSAAAICVEKPLWEKGIVLLSALPIAIICNVIRIVATGVLFEVAGKEMAKLVFHDLAGWLMMLLAVGLLRLELWILSGILIDPPDREVVPVLPDAPPRTSRERSTRTQNTKPATAT